MKKTIKMTLLGALLLASGLALAGVTKATFDVTFSDGTQGTIYVGSKITNKALFTQCDYEDVNGKYLGTLNIGNTAGGTNWPGGGLDPETHIFYSQASMSSVTTGSREASRS